MSSGFSKSSVTSDELSVVLRLHEPCRRSVVPSARGCTCGSPRLSPLPLWGISRSRPSAGFASRFSSRSVLASRFRVAKVPVSRSFLWEASDLPGPMPEPLTAFLRPQRIALKQARGCIATRRRPWGSGVSVYTVLNRTGMNRCRPEAADTPPPADTLRRSSLAHSRTVSRPPWPPCISRSIHPDAPSSRRPGDPGSVPCRGHLQRSAARCGRIRTTLVCRLPDFRRILRPSVIDLTPCEVQVDDSIFLYRPRSSGGSGATNQDASCRFPAVILRAGCSVRHTEQNATASLPTGSPRRAARGRIRCTWSFLCVRCGRVPVVPCPAREGGLLRRRRRRPRRVCA